ncbi:hemolysin secretion protein D, partial [Enterobacter cloacae complex sp. 743-2DZ2F-22B]
VQEGDIVEKGQILLKIDPTRAGASYGESLSKVQGLKGSIARLRAEAYDTPLTFPPEIAGIESIVRDETQAYNARLKTLNESVQALQRSLALAQNEVSLSEPLARKGLMSDVEILRLKRQANEFSLQIAERTNRFRSDANSELNRLESELAQAE